MKDIKDYLPFYIGCDCIDSQGDIYKISYHLLQHYSSELKPILRSVRGLTDDEAHELGRLKLLEEGYTLGLGGEPSVHRYYYTPEGMLWYLKKGFDIFGLIDAGLAEEKF